MFCLFSCMYSLLIYLCVWVGKIGPLSVLLFILEERDCISVIHFIYFNQNYVEGYINSFSRETIKKCKKYCQKALHRFSLFQLELGKRLNKKLSSRKNQKMQKIFQKALYGSNTATECIFFVFIFNPVLITGCLDQVISKSVFNSNRQKVKATIQYVLKATKIKAEMKVCIELFKIY